MHEEVRFYTIKSLEGAPSVFEALAGLVRHAEQWDARPVEDRFTLREIYAHMADWETIFVARIRLILGEERPELPYVWRTPLELAGGYATADPSACVDVLREARLEHVALLSLLDESGWLREGIHPRIGPITIEAHATMVAGHDGYHTAQIAEWLKK